MTAPPLLAAMYMVGAVAVAWGTHGILWRRLFSPGQIPVRRWLPWCGALFPLGMAQLLFMRQAPRALAAPLMWAAFGWVGVVYFLLCALILFEVITMVLRPGPNATRRLARVSVGCALVVALFAVAEAHRAPEVVRAKFSLPSTLSGSKPLSTYRIVQLSDVHIGPTLGRSFARSIVERVNALDVDLVVISGDLVDGSVAELAAEVAPLAALRAKYGVAFVLGNHEYLSGADDWIAHLKGFGWHVLRNARFALPHLDVVGVDDFAASDFDPAARPNLVRALEGRGPARLTLLVAHQPRAFAGACGAGVDLAIAGHTHGGQLFPLGLLEWLDHGYVAGRYQCGATQLYVSRGVGYWGPPMRLGSRAEITLLELVHESREERDTADGVTPVTTNL